MKQSQYESIYSIEMNHWWYRVRRSLVQDLIKRYSSNNNLSILDVGCGAGALMKELEKYGEVSGVDFSPIAVEFCRSRGIKSVQVSGIEKLPFDSNTFDFVLALDVLEHIPDDNLGVSEILRVLKPGGKAIIFVPAFMFLWGVTDEVSLHYRRYRLMELSNLFKINKFKSLEKSYFNTFLFLPIASVRLFARFFKIHLEDENSVGGSFTNKALYTVFNLERFFLKFMRFPFGISCLLVVEKL